MKILSSNDFETEILRLLNEYEEYYWSVAWASNKSNAFELLKTQRHKIKKIIVGLHFYQTHPEFISEFLNDRTVKYIFETGGTFHPKLYLFKSTGKWEFIIGSPNFTNAAFSKNSEISMLVSSTDNITDIILSDVENFINKAWNNSIHFTEKQLSDYKNNWKHQHKKVKHLSGIYGNNETPQRPIFETKSLSLSWSEFLEIIKNEQNHFYKNRITVIKTVQKLFRDKPSFNMMNMEERKYVAGVPNRLNEQIIGAEHAEFFGSMKGAGDFKKEVNENNINISIALDQIPLEGHITKQHYLNFLSHFEKISDKNYFAPATRLLCMKRPDYFICFNSKNKDSLCKDFEIKKSVDKDYYWDEIIERIFDSSWWQTQEPDLQDEEDRIIYNARTAFLDSIFYEGQ